MRIKRGRELKIEQGLKTMRQKNYKPMSRENAKPITIFWKKKKRYHKRHRKESKDVFKSWIILQTPCKRVLGVGGIPGGLPKLHELDDSHPVQAVPEHWKNRGTSQLLLRGPCSPLLSEAGTAEVGGKAGITRDPRFKHPKSYISKPSSVMNKCKVVNEMNLYKIN